MTTRCTWLAFSAALLWTGPTRAETLDIASFTGPPGWQRDAKRGLVTLGMNDAKAGS